MVSWKQSCALEWAIQIAEEKCPRGIVESWDEQIKAARIALAQVRSDRRAALAARRQAVPAPRRALQRVGAPRKVYFCGECGGVLYVTDTGLVCRLGHKVPPLGAYVATRKEKA